MKRLTSFLNRWRRDEPADASAQPATPRRRWPILLGAALGLAAVTAVAVWLLSGDEATRPAPAVPPGQLAREMEETRSTAPSDVITIDEGTAQILGLQTAMVEARIPDEPIRTTGRVTPDERRIAEVHTKIDGWIEKAFVDFVGEPVRTGQPLFTIYSPELVATQQELLLAIRAERDFDRSEFEVVRSSGDSLVAAARRRLRLWDMTAEQVAEVERTGTVQRTVTVFSPASGVVTERKAFPGSRVTPEMALYRIADLSPIWVEADVFEVDLPAIQVGSTGEVRLPGGEVRSARVTFVNPMVDPQTRTAAVRLELPNPGLTLKPGMFVDVTLSGRRPTALVVPRDAVLVTGLRNLVLVQEGEGRFALREIRLGPQGQEYFTVLSGLSAGERVARNIQFLIDSETQIRNAIDRRFPTLPDSSRDGTGADTPPTSPAPATPAPEHRHD